MKGKAKGQQEMSFSLKNLFFNERQKESSR